MTKLSQNLKTFAIVAIAATACAGVFATPSSTPVVHDQGAPRAASTSSALVPVHARVIDFAKIDILTQPIAPNFYALTGSPGIDPGHPEAAGGRIGVLVGPDGVFVVDASYAPLTEKVMAAIHKLSPSPIRFLVNTHSHPDHSGGNANFARQGALLFSREETRETLTEPLPAIVGTAASSTDPERLPVVTYGPGTPVKIRMNGEVIDLIPLAAAHTNGDTIVRFEHADVFMIGDFYRNYGYPFVDALHGGSFKGVLEAIDEVSRLSGPNSKLLPGHGTIIGRADLAPYRAMIVRIQGSVQQMIRAGSTKQEVLAAKLTAPYDAHVAGGVTPLPAGLGTSADRFVGAVYAELALRAHD